MRAAISSSRLADDLAELARPLQELGPSDLLEHGDCRGARERVAAEGAAQPARLHGIDDLRRPGDGRQREAAAQRLPRDEEVGLDPVLLDRPDGPGTTDAALHLVGDEQDPVAAEQLLKPLREVGRHRDESALALNGLEHGAGDRPRIDLGLEELLDRGERVVGRDASVRVRRRRAVDLRCERPEALLVLDLAGHRHRQQGPPVERSAEDEDGGTAGRRARDLDRVLDGLRAAIQENASLVGAPARRDLGEQAAHLDVGFVHPDHEALVQIAVELLADRLNRGREPVAGVLAAEAAGEVDVRAPVCVLDPRAFGAGDDERRRGYPARDVPFAGLDHRLGRGRLTQGHGRPFSQDRKVSVRKPLALPGRLDDPHGRTRRKAVCLMARTPIAQSLETIAAEAAAERGLTRRDLLRNAGALGVAAAGTTTIGRLIAAAEGAAAPRTVVVGAGLAGLTAAYRLKQAGINAQVHEASDRVGGRCWTIRGEFAEGQIAEHGGELIDQGHTAIRQLAGGLGLQLDNLLQGEENGTEPTYYFDGKPYSYAQATDDLKLVWQKIHSDISAASYPTLYNMSTPRGRELDRMSIVDWIEESVPGGMQLPARPAARRRLHDRVRRRFERAELPQPAVPPRLPRPRAAPHLRRLE